MTAIETVQTVPLTQTSDGTIQVTGTRIPLDTIIHHYNQGAIAEEIVNRFPAVSLGKVYAVIAYYLSHKPELDAYLKEQEEADAAFITQLETDPQYQADRVLTRERLTRRWEEMQKTGSWT